MFKIQVVYKVEHATCMKYCYKDRNLSKEPNVRAAHHFIGQTFTNVTSNYLKLGLKSKRWTMIL